MLERHSPPELMSWWEFGARLSWVLLRLVLAYCVAGGFQPFFYQAF